MAITTLSAQAVADLVGGRLLGNGALPLSAIGPLDRADGRTLSFLSGPRYLAMFHRSAAGAVLLREDDARHAEGPATRIVVEDPAQALLRVVPALFPESAPTWGVDPTAVIGRGARWEGEVSIGPHAVLGRDVRLGSRCRIGAGVVLHDGVLVGDDCDIGTNSVCHEGTRLGHRVRLKALAVVGGDGFGFASGPEGHRAIRHIGGCILEDDVQVGSHSAIDRGSLDDTVIGAGTKIPHLTYVGDADIGDETNIGAATVFVNYDGVAKHRTVVGKHARIGSDTMLVAPVTIGDGAYTAAGSVITEDVPPGDLALGRARQRNIDGWVASRRPDSDSARAAEEG